LARGWVLSLVGNILKGRFGVFAFEICLRNELKSSEGRYFEEKRALAFGLLFLLSFGR
jgi:hypothetical protein